MGISIGQDAFAMASAFFGDSDGDGVCDFYDVPCIGDLNGDGLKDIAVATSQSGILVMLQNTEETWHTVQIPFPDNAGTGKGVAIGDLTGDGVAEITVTTEHASDKYGVYYLRFQQEEWQAVDIGGKEGTKFDRIELVDIDHDGDLDVLTCEEKENLGVIWYENPLIPRGDK